MFLLFFSLFSGDLIAEEGKELFVVGYKSFYDGFYLTAVNSFEEYLRYYPSENNSDEARYLLGLSYFNLGKYKLAVKNLNRLIYGSPNSDYLPRAFYWQGMCFYRLGEYKKAMASFNRFVYDSKKVDFYYTYSLFYKAKALEKIGSVSNALKVLKGLLEVLDNSNADFKGKAGIKECVLAESARLSMLLNRYADAKDYYGRLLFDFPSSKFGENALFYIAECDFYLKNYRDSGKRYKRFIETFPNSKFVASAYYRLAYLENVNGNLKDALDYVSMYLERFPKGELLIEVEKLKGDILLAMGRYEEALNTYRYLIDFGRLSDEELHKAEYNVGLCYKNMGKFSNALEYFKRLSVGVRQTGCSGLESKAELNYALCLYKLRNMEDAERIFVNILSQCEGNRRVREDVLLWLANIYEEKGDFQEAYDRWNDLIESYPDSARIADYYFHMGNVAIELGSYDDAIRAFDTITVYYSDVDYLPMVYYQIGYVYGLKKEYSRAISFFDRVLHLARDEDLFVKTEYAIASAYYNIGDEKKARDSFNRVISSGNKTLIGDAYLQLGKLEYRERRFRVAINDFTRAFSTLRDRQKKAEALSWKGWAEFRSGDFVNAEKTFISVAEDFSDFVDISIDAFYRAGISASQAGKYKIAIDHFNMALSLLSNRNVETIGIERMGKRSVLKGILYSMILACINSNDIKGIEISLKKLVMIFPSDNVSSDALFKVGKYFYDSGDFSKAIDYFTRVVLNFNDSNREIALYWRERANLKVGNLKDAIEDSLDYLSSYGTGAFAKDVLSDLDLAMREVKDEKLIDEMYKRIVVAEKGKCDVRDVVAFEYALFKCNKNPELSFKIFTDIVEHGCSEDIKAKAEFEIARFYGEKGEINRAISILQVVSDRDSGLLGAKALLLLAKLLERSGKTDMAIQNYLKIDYLFSEYSNIASEALYRLYKIYRNIGSNRKAEMIKEKLLKKFPESKWIPLLRGS